MSLPTRPRQDADLPPAPARRAAGDDGDADAAAGDLYSSATGGEARRPSARASGTIRLGDTRVSEAEARRALHRAFTRAGLAVEADYPLRAGHTMLSLDGYDPIARVGYQYVSHSDADVVTDFDVAAEATLRRLDEDGTLRVLIVHDGDVRGLAELEAMATAFLAALGRHEPAPPR